MMAMVVMRMIMMADNGGHEDDNDDNVGHMDMDDEGQSDGEANEFEAMLKDLARAPDEAEGEGGQDSI